MLWELLQTVWRALFKKEKASIAIEGFDRFSARMEHRLNRTEERLDECDRDRAELREQAEEQRSEIACLRMKVVECDEDRAELREKINRHSIEIDNLKATTPGSAPQIPHRTTRQREE
jgi:predicted nuclease with TOPRIM domain